MRGVTLIETVLVIAFLGILGVTAIELTPSPAPAQLYAAAQQVQSDIEYAKQNAMATGVTSGATFTKNKTYTVYQSTTATPLTNPLTQIDMVITLSDNYPGVTLNTNYTVEFDNFGNPTTGGAGSVTITNTAGTKTIAVTANTGMVQIQ